MSDDNAFGELLRRRREEAGLTQAEVALLAKITRAYLCELESGKKRNPTDDVLRRLAAAIPTTIDELRAEAMRLRPLEIDGRDGPPAKRRLAVVFARRLEEGDMQDPAMVEIARLMGLNEEDF